MDGIRRKCVGGGFERVPSEAFQGTSGMLTCCWQRSGLGNSSVARSSAAARKKFLFLERESAAVDTNVELIRGMQDALPGGELRCACGSSSQVGGYIYGPRGSGVWCGTHSYPIIPTTPENSSVGEKIS